MIVAITANMVEFALSFLTLATLFHASTRATEKDWSEAASWVLISLEPAILLLVFHVVVRWATP